METGRSRLVSRLESYWRLEAFNAVGIPLMSWGLLVVFGGRPGWLSVIAAVPMTLLLAIGSAYWRAKLHQISGDRSTLDRLLPVLDRLQLPTLAAVVVAVAAVVMTLSGRLWADSSTGDRVVAVVFVALAVLEYINYYHRQLQHFDHGPDWRRLVGGRGLRRAWLAKDLARYRS